MTEQEWLNCTDPVAMLNFLGQKTSGRKLRLFGCACCRRIWHLLSSRRSMEAIYVLERFVDTLPGGEKLPDVRRAARQAVQDLRNENSVAHQAARAAYTATIYGDTPGYYRVIETARLCAEAVVESSGQLTAWSAERAAQANLLRDLFGNRFRTTEVAPAWLAWNDGIVVHLARSILENGRFEEVPILADAFEEAGCDNADILNHCRQPDEHVRGCWVVDLLLNKS